MFIQVSRPPPGLQRELTEPHVERSPIQLFHTIHGGLAQAGGSHWMERGAVPQVSTFAGHHGPRLKALVAGALEASHHVGAGAVPTGIANGALVRVWGAQQRVEEEDGEGLGWALAGRALKLSQQSRQGREGAGEQ